jgi:hypothetical protein
MDSGSDSDAWIHPRDILTPVATLVGFVAAAIGLSATVAGVSDVLRALSLGLLSVVVLFVGAAFVTCVASLRRSRGIFKAAQILYMMGWVSAGLFLCLLLLGFAWGIQILKFKIPNFPSLDLQTVFSLVMGLIGIFSSLVIFQKSRIDVGKLSKEIVEIPVNRANVNSIVESALQLDDPKMAFLRVMIDLERTLRDLAIKHGYSQQRVTMRDLSRFLELKGIIDPITSESLAFVWRIRNMVAHGSGDVSLRDARVALDLAATILAKVQERQAGSDAV